MFCFLRDLNLLKAGVGEKLGFSIYILSAFVSSTITAIFFSWEISLITCAVATPVFLILAFLLVHFQSKYTMMELTAFSKAGSLAEGALGAIKTVSAFGGQDIEAKGYEDQLAATKKIGIKNGSFMA